MAPVTRETYAAWVAASKARVQARRAAETTLVRPEPVECSGEPRCGACATCASEAWQIASRGTDGGVHVVEHDQRGILAGWAREAADAALEVAS